MQEKYGFVYLWFDKKYPRFYLGRHWGTEDDGYICSSNMMRDAYKRRPHDFKRRIVKIVYDKEELVLEEQRYLDMIKPEECGVRYYNRTLKSTTPSMRGKKHSEETKRRMSESQSGKKHSEETKEKLRQINLGKKHSEETKRKIGRPFSKERRQSISEKIKEHNAKNERTPEHRKKLSDAAKLRHKEGRAGTGMLGKKHSEESKSKMASYGMLGKKHSEESINKMIKKRPY